MILKARTATNKLGESLPHNYDRVSHKSSHDNDDPNDNQQNGKDKPYTNRTARYPRCLAFTLCISFTIATLVSKMDANTTSTGGIRSSISADSVNNVTASGELVDTVMVASSKIGTPEATVKPRIIAVTIPDSSYSRKFKPWQWVQGEELPIGGAKHVYKTFRQIDSAMMINAELEDKNNSSKSSGHPKQSFDDGVKCVRQHDWQVTSFPNCNTIHETNFAAQTLLSAKDRYTSVELVNSGYRRDVWKAHDLEGIPIAAKTMRFKYSFEEREFERFRIDGVTMERLTSSPHIPNIYGFCGFSGFFEFSSGGDILDNFWDKDGKKKKELTFLKALQVAEEVALGLTALHTIEGDKYATIIHADMAVQQYILIDGKFKLNDFNRSQFLGWNKKLNEVCPAYYGFNGGKYRSPEEYAYDPETEMVDVYSMGNIIYSLTTGYAKPFDYEKISSNEAIKIVLSGGRPYIPSSIIAERENNPAIDSLLKVIEMCWAQNPKERAKAKDIAIYIRQRLDEIENEKAKSEDK